MGIGIGSGQGGIMYGATERKIIKNGNRVTTRTILRRADGSYAGSISVTKSAPKKTKRLNYNFKEISAMILQTKTSGSARQVAGRARGKVALLKQRLKCGEYDDKELEAAIIHAEKMERIARKRMRHLQEEEMAKRGGPCFGELEEECDDIQPEEEAEQEEELELDRKQQDAMLQKRQQEIQQEMQQMMREMEQAQREFEQEMSELSDLDELSDALGGGVARDMDPEDLDALKKKHRLDEQREIMEADMAYLKVLFNKLAQEKQQGSSSASGSSGGSGSYDGGSGVSLELGGMEMPVETAEAPVMPEGGSIDTTV